MRTPWEFYDGTNTVELEVNPSSFTMSKTKNLTAKALAFGNEIIHEGEDTPYQYGMSGTVLTEGQYDALVEWSSKNQQIRVTDDLGRATWMTITKFDPTRRGKTDWRMEYTLTATGTSLSTGTLGDIIPPPPAYTGSPVTAFTYLIEDTIDSNGLMHGRYTTGANLLDPIQWADWLTESPTIGFAAESYTVDTGAGYMTSDGSKFLTGCEIGLPSGLNLDAGAAFLTTSGSWGVGPGGGYAGYISESGYSGMQVGFWDNLKNGYVAEVYTNSDLGDSFVNIGKLTGGLSTPLVADVNVGFLYGGAVMGFYFDENTLTAYLNGSTPVATIVDSTYPYTGFTNTGVIQKSGSLRIPRTGYFNAFGGLIP